MAEITLWTCLGLVAYSYLIYPALVWAAARVWGAPAQATPVPDDALPSVSILVAAHNEEDVIAQRVANLLASDYPHEKLEVLVGSDGSSDRTNQIVDQVADPRVRLLAFDQRGGKASVLNRSAPEARGEVLVLTDANTDFAPSAVRRLVEALLAPGVTVACGRLVLVDPADGSNVDGLYWRYETFIKRAEGRLHAVLGANGANYALRNEHFTPLPPHTIIDDFLEPLLAKLRHGGAIVYQPESLATEETAPAIGSEFARRARIGAGGFQSLPHVWRLVSPRYGWTALAFVSHKLLRWVTPFLLVGALVANVALACQPGYAVLLAAQGLFYAGSLVGAFYRGGGAVGRALRMAAMFTGMNAALAYGFVKWLLGLQRGTWRRTTRT